jgi:flagellar hook-associated protein 3 FlgL
MRISTGQIFQQGLAAMLSQQSALAKTQQQIATGKTFASPADDPVAAVRALSFEREFNLLGQYIGNGNTAIDKLATEEDGLKGVTNVLQRIRELAIQGLNDTNTQVDRAAIAQEILTLNEQLLSFANTRDASGNYLYSGFSTDTQPYTSIGASYSGDEGQRNIQVGPGVLIETNDPGNAIFEAEFTETVVTDNAGPSSAALYIASTGVNSNISPAVTISFASPDTLTVSDGTNNAVVTPYVAGEAVVLSDLNTSFPDLTVRLDGALANGDSYTLETQLTTKKTVFSTVNDFANALINDSVGSNDSPNNGDFLTNISSVLQTVIDTQAKIGARINVIEQQAEINDGLTLSVQETLSDIQDLDYAEAISRFTQQSTALQAAQQTFAQVQNLSLFNYL